MAETAAQGSVPTFKLVLVGDGGTGKVRCLLQSLAQPSQ
jgi:GTPase SAR1 family protein